MATRRDLASETRPSNNHVLLHFPFDSEPLDSACEDVLPPQFYKAPHCAAHAPGEVALMRAVLEEAIDCFSKQFLTKNRRAQRLAKEAEAWMLSDEGKWPFSFLNICAVLGLEPTYIRQGLRAWSRSLPPAIHHRRRPSGPRTRSPQLAA